jgi:hypothetical protein
MAVQSKGRMDVQTSIDSREIALRGVLSSPLPAAMPERELAVFHQKIVDTRFRQ